MLVPAAATEVICKQVVKVLLVDSWTDPEQVVSVVLVVTEALVIALLNVNVIVEFLGTLRAPSAGTVFVMVGGFTVVKVKF